MSTIAYLRLLENEQNQKHFLLIIRLGTIPTLFT